MHFDDGLADKSGPEECPEWNEEVAARDACQIKEGVGDLQKTMPQHQDPNWNEEVIIHCLQNFVTLDCFTFFIHLYTLTFYYIISNYHYYYYKHHE